MYISSACITYMMQVVFALTLILVWRDFVIVDISKNDEQSLKALFVWYHMKNLCIR